LNQHKAAEFYRIISSKKFRSQIHVFPALQQVHQAVLQEGFSALQQINEVLMARKHTLHKPANLLLSRNNLEIGTCV